MVTVPRTATDLRKDPPRVQLKDESHVEVEEIAQHRPTHRIVIELNSATANFIWNDLVDNKMTDGLDDPFEEGPELNSLTRAFILAVKEVARR